MVVVDPEHGTVYLNAATVPRVLQSPHVTEPSDPWAHATQHHFLVVEVEDGEVEAAADTWVRVVPMQEGDSDDIVTTGAAAGGGGAAAPAALTGAAAAAGGCVGMQEDGKSTGVAEAAATSTAAAASGEGRSFANPGSSRSSSSGNEGSCGGGGVGEVAGEEVSYQDGYKCQVIKVQQVLRTVRAPVIGEDEDGTAATAVAGDKGGGVVKVVWNAHSQDWEQVVVRSRSEQDVILNA